MSSTRKGSRKSGADNYPTPEWPIRRFLEEWPELQKVGSKWLEPCVGDGVISEVVNHFRSGIEWTTCDIRETTAALRRLEMEHEHYVGDFLELEAFDPDVVGQIYDVAIFNPPFRLTMDFVLRCLGLARHVVVMQRMTFMGSDDRNEWFRKHLPDLYVIPNRVSFTGNGKSDSVENAWHVWSEVNTGPAARNYLLKTTPLSERKRGRSRIIRARDEVEVALDAIFSGAIEWSGPEDGDLWAPGEE